MEQVEQALWPDKKQCIPSSPSLFFVVSSIVAVLDCLLQRQWRDFISERFCPHPYIEVNRKSSRNLTLPSDEWVLLYFSDARPNGSLFFSHSYFFVVFIPKDPSHVSMFVFQRTNMFANYDTGNH